ncbi:sensor domain-containing diguanylate cyclase [Bacillus sp. T33-2]|uniref:sensor domain-containing diguanylate cyclase n=1 Tax=Bacillus sp. T33-2 TaxID=2054168 RepID=UPI0021559735|nr:diguanylate cyclase [Bacillus sp. T33-2]
MEEFVEQNLILQLKSLFLDLLGTNKETVSYDLLLEGMLDQVHSLTKAEQTIFYRYEELKNGFLAEAAVRRSGAPAFNPELRAFSAAGYSEDRLTNRRPAQFPGFEEYDLVLLLAHKEEILGIIALSEGSEGEFHSLTDRLLKDIAYECSMFLTKIKNLTKIIAEEKRYKQLYRVTEKFHSTMNMDDVLGEIISSLQEAYPVFTYYLMLSRDNHGHGDLPIKDLEYNSKNITAMQAYVSGHIQFEDSLAAKNSILYAPLKGKQGVYGVLQVIAPDALVFPASEVEFIKLLANTAGSALENAQLYEQSRRLIADLQLINQTSHRLNSNLRLTDTVNFMCGQILDSFNAREAGFIILDADHGEFKVLKGSTGFFFSVGASQYIEEIGAKIQTGMESLFIGDFDIQARGKSGLYRSIMCVPMIQSDSLKGFALVLHEEPYYFSFENFKLLQSLIHHSTLAFANSMLREELEKLVVTDHLTRLYSRSYLDEKMHLSMMEDDQGTFILIDIDNFKAVNDTYGHQVGDEVLVQLARMIIRSIRGSDIGTRWGGEELAIYLPGAPLETGVLIASRLVRNVEKYTKPSVTISCGVSTWIKGQDDSSKNLFKRADQALYTAKGSGKNKVVVQREDQHQFLSTHD